MASLGVPGNMAGKLQVPPNTVRRHLGLLEILFVVRRVPAWSSNLTTRAVAAPKLTSTDSGLAGHLAGVTARRAHRPETPIGPLLEHFVLGEPGRQLTWSEERVSLHHFRDRDGYEVDAVPAHARGDIVAVEVKASETVRSEDFGSLRRPQRRSGDQLIAGVVLPAGGRPLSFGPRLRA